MMQIWQIWPAAILLTTLTHGEKSMNKVTDLVLITVATNSTDGFQRYLRSTQIYDLDGKVLGMGTKWQGGNMKYPGGGYKINLLKKELEPFKDRTDLVVLFTDSYDVVVNAKAEAILQKFETFRAKVVFGAEFFCWPKEDLAESYPKIDHGQKYLNSGAFLGIAKELYEMVISKELGNEDDDQLFFTEIYINPEQRNKWGIVLDHTSEIFQNLNGAISDVELRFGEGGGAYLFNTKFDTNPVVIHGNGPSKRILNSLGNYLAMSWNPTDQCTSCWEENLDLNSLPELPQVVMGIFIEQPTPFIEEFFEKISRIDYLKSSIDLMVHSKTSYHADDVAKFVKTQEGHYNSIVILGPDQTLEEWEARNIGMEKCAALKCDFYFSVDSEAHLDNVHVLKLLIEQNRGVVAPLLVRPFKAWSNFWGALTSEGFYARSSDYMDLVQNSRRGLWNVPYISTCYLIHGSLIINTETRPNFKDGLLDPDMALCQQLRDKDIFFYVTNRLDWGHLINSEDFDYSHTNNELFEITNNQKDWENRYLHPNYSSSLHEGGIIKQPCPDVFWFPMVTERFADELIEEMEAFGSWSNGKNNDHRIEGGYEAVPTRDIHLKQIGMEDQWLEFLRLYVKPLVEKQYIGYNSDPPRAIMNFVVRYRPDEQPSLQPHHDASTYTINIALNSAGIDYTGGGCKFLRYNCAIPDTKKGWMLLHPGRLTHYHEGLETTSGTRYIMISFVDP